MSFSKLLIGGWVFISIAVFSNSAMISGFVPSAQFNHYQSRIGISAAYNTIQGQVIDQSLFMNYQLSSKLHYGIEFFKQVPNELLTRGSRSQNNFKTLMVHHFSIELLELLKDSDYHLKIAAGINYLASEPIKLVHRHVYNETIAMSWVPTTMPLQIDWAITRSRYQINPIFFSAFRLLTDWGNISLEWDNHFLNLSSKIELFNQFSLTAGLTKNMNNPSELVFTSSLSVVSFPEQPIVQKSYIEPKLLAPTISTSAGLKHIQNGLEHYYNGEFKLALKSYLLAKEFFPNSYQVHERLGSIQFKLADYSDAIDSWSHANAIQQSETLDQYLLEAKSRLESRYQ
tara:strand:- start:791 stop:1819 length:1029 start_codon:yes stop_codon:yes gene_type:complete